MLFVLNHQAQLAVGIDVATGIGNVVMQHITGVWHIGCTHAPQHVVILYAVEQFKVLRL